MTPSSPSHQVGHSASRVSARVRHAARIMLPLLALPANMLSAQGLVGHPSADATAKSCLEFRPTETLARPDSNHTLYVEQESVASQVDGRILVVGEPVFLWRRAGGRSELINQDSLVGMVITPPAKVTPLVTPLKGHSLGSMRSVALPDGWWLVTFAEMVRAPEEAHPKVVAMWAGETDGSTWRDVRKLPEVADSLVSRKFSALAYSEKAALLAVQSQLNGQPRVVLFARAPEGWSATSIDVGNRAYVAAAMTKTHALLAVVRGDTTESDDKNSLFLYARPRGDSLWTRDARIVRGLRSPVRDPTFTPRSDGLLLSWRVTSDDVPQEHAWSTRLTSRGEPVGPLRQVTNDAGLMYHTSRGDRGVWAVTNHGRPPVRVQLIEHDEAAIPTAAHSSAINGARVLGASLTSKYFVLVSSRRGTSPDEPAVVSVVHAYPWRCQ